MKAELTATVRAGEWWHYKLVPIFTAFLATLVMLGSSVAAEWQAAMMLLAAMVAGAAFVSVLNDVTDVEEDCRAGKANRMAGRSRAYRAVALILPVAVGLVFLVLWRDDLLIAGAYLAAWIAFSLYSLPPFRLKLRGLSGVLADACGAHLFPTLVAVILAFRAAERPVEPIWMAAWGAWALGYGLRGILWHQLSDRDNDQAGGARTFAARHAPLLVQRIGAWAAFPLELIGLAAIIGLGGTTAPLWGLALYLWLVRMRVRRWSMRAVLVAPRPNYLIWLQEYYDVVLPLALLIASGLRHPQDLAATGVYVVLFRQRLLQSLEDGGKLLHLIYLDVRYRKWKVPRQNPVSPPSPEATALPEACPAPAASDR